MRLATTAVLLGSILSACGSAPRSGSQVHALVVSVTKDAEALFLAGQPAAALRAARQVDRVDPSAGLEARLLASGEADVRVPTPMLGDVRAAREPIERSTTERVLLYLPDRILDLLDLVSFELSLGPGLWVDAHATHAAQLAFGSRETTGIGWHEHRSLGLRHGIDRGTAIFGYGELVRFDHLHGTVSGLVASGRMQGAHSPRDPYYRDLRDYWELGASAQLLLVGAEVDFHVLELHDFLAGLATFDPGEDDLAGFRAWDPPQQMRLRLEALGEAAVDERSLEDYARYREERAAAEAAQAAEPAQG